MTNFKIRFVENEEEVERVSELVNALQHYQKMKVCPRLPTGKNLVEELTHIDNQHNFRPSNKGTFIAIAVIEQTASSFERGAIHRSNIVGYLIYSQSFNILHGRDFYINSFFIEQDYRRHGIGRKFIEFIREHAKSVGIDSFDVPVMNDNHFGHRFYATFGSYPVNEDYYLFGEERDKIESLLLK